MSRKRVGIQLAKQAQNQTLEQRYSLELEGLAKLADIVEIRADTPAEFAAGVRDVDAIITSWGLRIDAQVIDNLKQCVVIGVGSVGVDMVDVDAATAAGIVVTNVPDVFIEEVADYAMMLLLNVSRLTPAMARMARDGQWYQGRPILSRVPRVMGQTLGLFAFGNVARCTARRAQAFGLRVIAHDPYVSELELSAAGVEPDEAALIDALRNGRLAGAGLDVLEQEPPRPDNPLLQMENVLVTPHVASASTRMRPETRRRVGREVALVLRGRWPMSCVNPTVLPKVALERWQPYPMSRGPNR
ncbi:MAG: C-terminal binding protein [Proteobacteria bacterium]|nr:C-terminal binding protein [Pseudomonadota bacterium]